MLGSATVALCLPASGMAQVSPPPPVDPDPAPLDPSAPMAPLPDLGIDWPDLDWPDLDGPDAPDAPVTAASPARPEAVRADRTSGDAPADSNYAIVVEGIDGLGDAELILADFSKQSALAGDGKANAAQVTRRSRADSDLLIELLRSRGYYDASVEPRIDRDGDGLRVVLAADPGEQYRFAAVDLPGIEAAGEDSDTLRAAFAVKSGDPVIAADVIAAGAALTTALGQEGFALAKVGEQDIVINHQTQLATLTLPVDPGPVAHFGVIRVTGKPPFSSWHLATIARFREGERFRQSRIDDLRRALVATTLVSNADIALAPREGGRIVDVTVALSPAPSRTIAGELGYGTGQGVRAEASWTNRNFFNPEGALTLRAVGGTKEQLAGIQLRRSNFRRRDQTLNLIASASHREYDAYEARTVLLAGNIERQSTFIWQKTWTYSGGFEVLATDERGVFSAAGLKDTRGFLIAALPVTLGYDGSDSLLDPTRGFRLAGRVSPEVSVHDGNRVYARMQFDASAYRPVSDRVVLAGRVRVGTILGAGTFDMAPSRRFYAGGGGSVRGYGYQRLGPLDQDGDPVGGRGLLEFGAEARIRLSQFGGNFGIVPFFDGGSLTNEAIPDVKDWRFAAGIGLRYYSNFGPIRIDLGVPLNRRKGDGPVALTVSLGQAF